MFSCLIPCLIFIAMNKLCSVSGGGRRAYVLPGHRNDWRRAAQGLQVLPAVGELQEQQPVLQQGLCTITSMCLLYFLQYLYKVDKFVIKYILSRYRYRKFSNSFGSSGAYEFISAIINKA